MYVLPFPKTEAEFDQLCERYRHSLLTTFDFAISDKKKNKLRDAVSRMLGCENGYQQLKTHFTEPVPHVEMCFNTLIKATYGNNPDMQELALATFHERMVFVGYDTGGCFEAEYSTAHAITRSEFLVNRRTCINHLSLC